MAGNKSGSENVLNFFAKMYKGEEHTPATAFHGLSTVCHPECGYKD